jgi:hypothetical protein
MGGSVITVDTYVLAETSVLNFIFLIILGIILYFGVMSLFENMFGAEFTQLYHKIRQGI